MTQLPLTVFVHYLFTIYYRGIILQFLFQSYLIRSFLHRYIKILQSKDVIDVKKKGLPLF